MNELDILDDELVSKTSNDIMALVKWWESKRLIYNVILLAIELYIIYTAPEEKYFGTRGEIGLLVFFYHLFANFFYTAGWGTEILLNHYFKKLQIGSLFRTILFVIGLGFSIWMTWELYLEIFHINFE